MRCDRSAYSSIDRLSRRRWVEANTSGTASEISIPGYTLAGKTGTANKVVDVHGHGTYSDKDYVASFVGFAPAAHPQLEAIVVVNQPEGSEFYGTEVAAPAWQKIMDFALQYLKIAPG